MGLYNVIDNRANHALQTIAIAFQNILKPGEKNNHFSSTIDGIKSVETSYFLQNKWVGRIYIYQWRILLIGSRPLFPEIISLKFQKKQAFLHSIQSNDLTNKIMQHPSWKTIISSIDFEKLELFYNEKKDAWELILWPNFGDYIWMLLPPVRYYRKPNEEEQKAIEMLLTLISSTLLERK